jgi:hypothetical protein
MRSIYKSIATVAISVGISAGVALPAHAACQRYGFSVNDYGKDGPARDAKELLDKLIAKRMAERGVSKYSTGTKDVKCEMFLNFILFDEYTCTAEATACWDGTPLPKGEATEASASKSSEPAKKAKAAEAKPAAKSTPKATVAAKHDKVDAKPVEKPTAEVKSEDETAAPETAAVKSEEQPAMPKAEAAPPADETSTPVQSAAAPVKKKPVESESDTEDPSDTTTSSVTPVSPVPIGPDESQ